MADSKKYTVQEALNRVMNDDDKSLSVKLTDADQVTIAGTVSVALDSSNDSVETVPTAGSAVVLSASGQVLGAAGKLWSAQIDFVGTTIGDKVELKNATTDSGTSLMTFTSTVANQSFTFTPPVHIAYSAGIFAKETIDGSGDITMTIVYSAD